MTQNQLRKHLNSNEIAQWLVEGPSKDAEAHLRNCLSCQASLAEAEQPLAVFRTAVVGWSESQTISRSRARQGEAAGWRARFWVPAVSLALAAAVLVALLAGNGGLHPPSFQQQAKAPAVSDSVLMEQVDAEVSEAVPDAMSPLTDLVAWDSGAPVASSMTAGEGSTKKRLQGGQKAAQND